MPAMMNESKDLLNDTRNLAARFKNSGLYRDYLRHKKALENDTVLFERVMAYKKSRIELESKRLQEAYVSFDEEKRLAYQYTELSLHPEAGAFLACEFELLKLYEQAFDILSEACEIE